MIIGDIKKINLSISSFERMISNGCLYVDKTKLIENFLNTQSDVQLVARQRRLGKSLNMDMLRCFLTDKTDNRRLFKGLYIESSPVWEMANSAPVFYFDFKRLNAKDYARGIFYMICEYIDLYCKGTDLSRMVRSYIDKERYEDTNGLFYLTEEVYQATGKRSYILIDEYDKLLMDNYNTDQYEEILSFETALLSSGLKGNHHLEKALLTGVMRVSHESMMSGLNNLVTFDVFNDDVYTDDYGLTEEEAVALSQQAGFDLDEARAWYNGVKINGHAIYNIYSVMSYISRGQYDCYWGKSGTLDLIIDLLNDNRKLTLAELLNGTQAEVAITNRISLKHLMNMASDEAFYSMLVQAGYLTLDGTVPNKTATALVSIPNKELMKAWKDFILESLYTEMPQVRTLFDRADNLDLFSKDLEYFLSDRLSYHDLATYQGENESRVRERVYHIFLLGILSAYDDVRCLSNRESGDGRYDIFVERPDRNYIFEFKACGSKDDLDAKADEALAQIEDRRYGADAGAGKPLVKVGVAFCGKLCRVRSKNLMVK
jgi:hypothetical protein